MISIDSNTLILALIAVLNVVTAITGFYTARVAKQTELNTNSMVTKVENLAFARGHEEARIQGEDKAATLARGVAQGILASSNGLVASPVYPEVVPDPETVVPESKIVVPEQELKVQVKKGRSKK